MQSKWTSYYLPKLLIQNNIKYSKYLLQFDMPFIFVMRKLFQTLRIIFVGVVVSFSVRNIKCQGFDAVFRLYHWHTRWHHLYGNLIHTKMFSKCQVCSWGGRADQMLPNTTFLILFSCLRRHRHKLNGTMYCLVVCVCVCVCLWHQQIDDKGMQNCDLKLLTLVTHAFTPSVTQWRKFEAIWFCS